MYGSCKHVPGCVDESATMTGVETRLGFSKPLSCLFISK